MNPLQPSADPDRTLPVPVADPSATVDVSADSTQPRLPSPPVGSPVVPGYHVTGEIAKGGMGRVYAAVDLTLDREVAIKTLLPGANADRFVTESKITAKLPHPGIPPVYALGTLTDGAPFLAMKLIRGRTLAAELADRRSPADDLPRFVQVFEQVAQAVGFAHSRGVIHRDLKPLNVMVGEFGEVQVMDWGLARFVAPLAPGGEGLGGRGPGELNAPAGSDNLTQAGAVMGTPAYMAPEQARGEVVDARADVFALGAMLMEVLTGERPWGDGPSAVVVARAARALLDGCHDVLAKCPADPELVAVARKCLSADASDRYPDGRPVADAVAAYRAGVEARAKKAEVERGQAETRAAETRKRQRLFTRAAGVVATVLLVGTAVSLWQMFRAITAEGQATTYGEKMREERDAKDVALTNEEQASAELLKALDTVVSEETSDYLATQKAVTLEQKQLLSDVLPLYQKFSERKGDDENARARIARAALNAGLIEAKLGFNDDALTHYRSALAAFSTLAEAHPENPDHRSHAAECRLGIGMMLAVLGDGRGAEEEQRQALALLTKLHADFPDVADHRYGLGCCHATLGIRCASRGDTKGAEREHREAVAIFEKLVTDFPANDRYRTQLAKCHGNLGNRVAGRGDGRNGEQQFRKSLALAQELATKYPAEVKYRALEASAHSSLGTVLSASRDVKGATAEYRLAIKQFDGLVADNPAVPEYREDLASCHYGLGNVFAEQLHDLKAAVEEHRRAVTLREQLLNEHPSNREYRQGLGQSCCNLAVIFRELGRPADSLPMYDKAVRTVTPVFDESPHDPEVRMALQFSHWGRAMVLDSLDRHKDGLNDWDLTVELSSEDDRPQFRAYRATAWVHGDRAAEALAEVAELRKYDGWPPGHLYDFAGVYSVAAVRIKHERQTCLNRAMEVLAQAVKSGFRDVAKLKADKDLDPLRERDDFKKLLADLEKKFPPKKDDKDPKKEK